MGTKTVPSVEIVDGAVGRLDLHRGTWLIGRGQEAHLRLTSSQVSTRHAWIRRDAASTWVVDAGSLNGTWVNREKLAAGQEHLLRNGDQIEFGPIIVVYRDPAAGSGTELRPHPAAGVSFGDVSAGTLNNAGRDINNQADYRRYEYDQRRYHRQDNRFEFTTPEGQAINELATGRGAGRAVMVIGLLMIVVGFGIWATVIFGFITAVSNQIPSPGTPSSSFDPPLLLGPPVFGEVPLGVVGFALFGIGIIVVVIGTVMSKAARERDRRSRRRRPSDGW
jgi:hypothetical protein